MTASSLRTLRSGRTFLAALALLPGSLLAQGLHATNEGLGAGEHFGTCVAAIGDIDGDGTSDHAVGAPHADGPGMPDRGEVRVLSGRTGLSLHVIPGTAANMRLGYAIAALGDVDGDNVPDFAIGAPLHDSFGGFVTVRTGATGAEIASRTGAPGSYLGMSLARIADYDGDGQDDLLVGAPGSVMSSTSEVQLLRLPACTLALTINHPAGPRAMFGSTMAAVGDVDGDTRPDVAIGAPGAAGAGGFESGEVFLLHTFGNGTWAIPYPWSGGFLNRLGTCVAAAGDVDGDGLADVLATGSLGGYGTACVLRSNATTPWRTVTGPPYESFGSAIAGIGDLNGDGRPEMIVGAPGARSYAGRGYVFDGSSGSSLFHVEGFQPGDRCGAAVAGLGDVDGDNQPDFATGRPYADGPTTDCGAVDIWWYPLPGSYEPFGAGCAGSNGIPTIEGAPGAPQLGGTLQLRARLLPSRAPALAILGVSNTQLGGLPLPIELTSLGLPGCSLYVSTEVVLPTATNSVGTAFGSALSVPTATALVGVRLYGQFAAFEASGALRFTPGIAARIGR